MSDTASGLLTIAVLVAALAVAHVPLGSWMARVFTDAKHWRVERLVYRLCRIDPSSQQRWSTYAVAVLGFSVVGIVLLFALIALQGVLPLARGASMHLDTALNTAVSFVTNTNWQSYAGESGTSPLVQTLGLTVQNFVSPAVGLAVAVALVRGLSRSSGAEIGNFWVDLVRGTVRVLLPLALVGAVVLLLGGVIQNLMSPTEVTTVSGGSQVIQGGLVASQEAIKEPRYQRGWLLQRELRPPLREPERRHEPRRDLPAARHPLLAAADLRHPRRRPPAGLDGARLHGDPVGAHGRRRDVGRGECRERTPRRPRGQGACASASGRPRSSRRARPARRPAPSTRCTRAYSALGGGGALFSMLLGEVSPVASARGSTARCSSPC